MLVLLRLDYCPLRLKQGSYRPMLGSQGIELVPLRIEPLNPSLLLGSSGLCLRVVSPMLVVLMLGHWMAVWDWCYVYLD